MKEPNFILLAGTYSAQTANVQRLMSFIRAWSSLNVPVEVVFVLPNKDFSKVENSYPGITFRYLWSGIKIHNRYLHYLLYWVYLLLFRHSLHGEKHLLLYGQGNLITFFKKNKKIHVYHETSEHPSACAPGISIYRSSISKYLNACDKLDGLFVISNSLKNYFQDNGVDKNIIRVINMTVDTERFIGVEKRPGTRRYIAYCGKASNYKDGVNLMIEAFAIVNKSYPDMFLYIIGKSDDPKEDDSNRQLAEDLGIKDKVVFFGTVNSVEIPQILKDASILLLCRPDNVQAKYGFPTKLGEYLLSGNPVVVTKVGDIPSYLSNQENAMVSSPDNPADFADKIIWLLDHEKEAKIIGEAGRQTAIESFNNIIEAKKIMDYIDSFRK